MLPLLTVYLVAHSRAQARAPTLAPTKLLQNSLAFQAVTSHSHSLVSPWVSQRFRPKVSISTENIAPTLKYIEIQ
ncbi:hypothetical protein EDB84DRAFT_1544794 [Lactarius hengduanensis]|nr:hypothetical protein EDB84DRAFT_1544794 [Lactarius hengduanensis]